MSAVADLLVDARDRREVRRADLGQLADDPLRVAAPERQRPAGLERRVLRDARERVGQRQEEVDHQVAVPQLELADVHRGGREQAGVGDDAALRRPGGARRVDDRRHVLGPTSRGARRRRRRRCPTPAGRRASRCPARRRRTRSRARARGSARAPDRPWRPARRPRRRSRGRRRGRGCTRTPRASWSGRSGRPSPRRSARRGRRASTPAGCRRGSRRGRRARSPARRARRRSRGSRGRARRRRHPPGAVRASPSRRRAAERAMPATVPAPGCVLIVSTVMTHLPAPRWCAESATSPAGRAAARRRGATRAAR